MGNWCTALLKLTCHDFKFIANVKRSKFLTFLHLSYMEVAPKKLT